jgi:hypothetical protein
MTTKLSLTKKFMGFMIRKIENLESFESPLALYEKFLEEWKKPLNAEALQHAYQAAWAISINQGTIRL